MGELARKPGAPTLPLTPEELFTGPGYGFTWYDKNVPKFIIAAFGFAAPCWRNWILKRPLFAGIYYHILTGGAGYFIGEWYTQFRLARKSEKDAILIHYMSLHPEEFPPIERQRYKDVFQKWVPRR